MKFFIGRIKYKLFELYIDRLTDQEKLIQIAQNHTDGLYRELAIEKIEDENILRDIVMNDTDRSCRRVAIGSIHRDMGALIDIIKNHFDQDTKNDSIGRVSTLILRDELYCERNNESFNLIKYYRKADLEIFANLGIFDHLISILSTMKHSTDLKKQIQDYLKASLDVDPYVNFYRQIALELTKEYGRLIRIEILNLFPNFENNFVFEKKTIFSGARTEDLDIHFLRFGYIGQGPRYTHAFLDECGFSLSTKDIAEIKAGAAIKCEEGKTLITYPEGIIEKENICWGCGKQILHNPVVLYPPEEGGRGVDVCFDCYEKTVE